MEVRKQIVYRHPEDGSWFVTVFTNPIETLPFYMDRNVPNRSSYTFTDKKKKNRERLSSRCFIGLTSKVPLKTRTVNDEFWKSIKRNEI